MSLSSQYNESTLDCANLLKEAPRLCLENSAMASLTCFIIIQEVLYLFPLSRWSELVGI